MRLPRRRLVHRPALRRGAGVAGGRRRSSSVPASLADQAGEARNDIPAIFFLLAAAGRPRQRRGGQGERLAGAGCLIVVGLAAGLAAGTKVNYLAPGLAPWSPASRQRAAGRTAAGAAPPPGSRPFWPAATGTCATSSTPATRCPGSRSSGPVGLPSPDQPLGGREEHGVSTTSPTERLGRTGSLPGLQDGFGVLWPAVLVLGAAGLVLCLVPGRRRCCACCGVVDPRAGRGLARGARPRPRGPTATRVGFFSGLRYLAPGARAWPGAAAGRIRWFESQSRRLALLGA